jgi:hypothetical protein
MADKTEILKKHSFPYNLQSDSVSDVQISGELYFQKQRRKFM